MANAKLRKLTPEDMDAHILVHLVCSRDDHGYDAILAPSTRTCRQTGTGRRKPSSDLCDHAKSTLADDLEGNPISCMACRLDVHSGYDDVHPTRSR
jgi:hypothetical protein